MLLKLILLAQCTVTGAYGFIELIFIENMNLGLKIALMLTCAVMFHLGCKGFKKNWNLFCSEENDIVEVRKQMQREGRKMAA
jgi:hypothetical protein